MSKIGKEDCLLKPIIENCLSFEVKMSNTVEPRG